jgi:YHS domain-containing protein
MKPLILLLILGASGASHAVGTLERLNKNGVALCVDRNSKVDSDCYDPVSYIKSQKAEKVGAENSKKYRAKFNNATYVFSSQDHLDLFNKNPEAYLPQFGGWCAYAVAAKEEKVDIDPKSFHVQDGKLLLFYDGFLSDTRATWLHDKKQDSKTYLNIANANWPSVQSKEP